MKLWGKCRKTLWPYLIVIFFSTIAAFITWITIGDKLWTAGTFLIVATLQVAYILNCMRRHCSGEEHSVQP